MKKRKTGTILLLLALGICAFVIVIVSRFRRNAELIHRVFPEVISLKYILMLYLDENGGLPADETQLIAHGHLREIHQGADKNLWEGNGGYLSREPYWNKLYFFEDFSISYGLSVTDMELSEDVVVDKAKKTPLLIINGPGSDKYLEFYQVETLNLYNWMCKNFNWTYNLDLEWTPLHEAVKNNNVEDVESLIKKGTDVNIKAPGLFTPLHVAATYGFVDIAKRLLKSGANVNARDTGGFTPLHVAAVTGQAEIAEILMKNGALISEKTNMRSDPYRSGETAEALAERYGHAEVAEVIRKYSKN